MAIQTVCVCRSWLLYVEPGYRGSCIVLEEGQTVQTGGVTAESDRPSAPTPSSVGSIRRAVKVSWSNISLMALERFPASVCMKLLSAFNGTCNSRLLHSLCLLPFYNWILNTVTGQQQTSSWVAFVWRPLSANSHLQHKWMLLWWSSPTRHSLLPPFQQWKADHVLNSAEKAGRTVTGGEVEVSDLYIPSWEPHYLLFLPMWHVNKINI